MLENRIDREQEPVSLPPYGDHRRVPVEVVQCPISYLYKKTQTEETVPVCAVLAKYLVRRVKYRDGEWGGILGMSDGVVTHYFPDHNGKTTEESYIPDSAAISENPGQSGTDTAAHPPQFPAAPTEAWG